MTWYITVSFLPWLNYPCQISLNHFVSKSFLGWHSNRIDYYNCIVLKTVCRRGGRKKNCKSRRQWKSLRKQHFPDTTGLLHISTFRDYDSMHRTYKSSNQTWFLYFPHAFRPQSVAWFWICTCLKLSCESVCLCNTQIHIVCVFQYLSTIWAAC